METKYLGWQVKMTFYRQVIAFGYREQASQVPEDSIKKYPKLHPVQISGADESQVSQLIA